MKMQPLGGTNSQNPFLKGKEGKVKPAKLNFAGRRKLK